MGEEEREKEDYEIYSQKLEILDENALILEPTIKKLYLILKEKKLNKHQTYIRKQVRKYYCRDTDGYVSYDEFK